jgi:hypothetical protein
LAQITTVWLADGNDRSFVMPGSEEAAGKADESYDLKFIPATDFPGSDAATITDCKLRIVAEKKEEAPHQQDVSISIGTEPISGWSAYGDDVKKSDKFYLVALNPNWCSFSTNLTLKVRSNSSLKDWTYYGPSASTIANRPRLIISYNTPTPIEAARLQRFTRWKYGKLCPDNSQSSSCPSATSPFFNSSIGTLDGDLLTNPVSYNGEVFVVGGPNVQLYRLQRGSKTKWPLSIETARDSVAFVTASGGLKVITKKKLYSCDLAKLTTAAPKLACASTDTELTIDPKETPAVGADGSVYFRGVSVGGEVTTNGRIVGFNPWRQKIWETTVAPAKISPITLTADGHYAYMLAKINNTPYLMRVDTWTGEHVQQKITDEQGTEPQFQDTGLLRPAVISAVGEQKGDYVFVAGNTQNNGTMALYLWNSSNRSLEKLWAHDGTVQTAPMLGTNGNGLFLVQAGTLHKYTWAQGVTPNPFSNLVDTPTPPMAFGSGNTLFIDAGQNIYRPPSEYNPQFWSDGAIIGYKDKVIYDISPKYAGPQLDLKALAPGTAYSAAKIAVSSDAARNLCTGGKLNCTDAVILKSNSVSLPAGFRWPSGATLHIVSVP